MGFPPTHRPTMYIRVIKRGKRGGRRTGTRFSVKRWRHTLIWWSCYYYLYKEEKVIWNFKFFFFSAQTIITAALPVQVSRCVSFHSFCANWQFHLCRWWLSKGLDKKERNETKKAESSFFSVTIKWCAPHVHTHNETEKHTHTQKYIVPYRTDVYASHYCVTSMGGGWSH